MLIFVCLGNLIHFLPSKLCTNYSYLHFQSQNRKIHVYFAKYTLKTCYLFLPVAFLADFCQKRSVKLLAKAKTKVYNRTRQTSTHSCAVGNEASTFFFVQWISVHAIASASGSIGPKLDS
jgi:hypothetical protein